MTSLSAWSRRTSGHETKQLPEGLPQLPRLEIDHRGVKVREFDIDAALKRKPAILLVDELAHANAPGCRHPKRWQDVEDLLAAGIDVFSTLNVQHLESLNHVVGGITGISVRETVPDEFFDEADDIVFVDTPPDELLTRLKEGKVYIAPGASERAVQNFFRKTNLQSLRELALRRTADYVDVDTDEQRRREGLSTPNIAGDRLMVCIGPDIFAAKLVRTGRRLASSLKAPWTCVYVETPGAAAEDRAHAAACPASAAQRRNQRRGSHQPAGLPHRRRAHQLRAQQRHHKDRHRQVGASLLAGPCSSASWRNTSSPRAAISTFMS